LFSICFLTGRTVLAGWRASGRSATPTTAFRKNAYGKSSVQSFLRDVLAMANAAVEGSRYIINLQQQEN